MGPRLRARHGFESGPGPAGLAGSGRRYAWRRMFDRGAIRRSAALFALASLPATVMIVAAGGIVGVAPVIVLLATMIVFGRLPGERSVQRLVERRSPARRRSRRRAARPSYTVLTHPIQGLLIASAMAERGPPPVAIPAH